MGRLLALLFAIIPALAGCVTAYSQGRAALQQERYDEAAGHFRDALAGDPGHLDARAGLGIARYKQGALEEAAAALADVVTRAPKHREARLYLGLTRLAQGDLGAAETHLAALLDPRPHPRIAAQLEAAIRLLRAGALSDEARAFIAQGLEHEVEWERDLREAERARPVYIERSPYWPLHLYPYRYWYP